MKKNKLYIFLIVIVILFAGCMEKQDYVTTQDKDIVASINGEKVTREDYEKYKKSFLVNYFESKEDFHNDELENMSKVDQYYYKFVNKMISKNEEEIFAYFLEELAVAKSAKDYGNPAKPYILSQLQQGQNDILKYTKNKEELLEISETTEDDLLENCFPYYAEIQYYIMEVENNYIKNIYLAETGDDMPIIDWDKNPGEEEIQEYNQKFGDWTINTLEGFAKYKQQLYNEAEIIVYEDVGK